MTSEVTDCCFFFCHISRTHWWMNTYCSCTRGGRGRRCEPAQPGRYRPAAALRAERAHLRLNHAETVRAHLRHHAQNIHKLVLSDVLHQTVESDERSRPADSRAESKHRRVSSLPVGQLMRSRIVMMEGHVANAVDASCAHRWD